MTQRADLLVPNGDRLDARPQPGDSDADAWARAMFAANEAFERHPELRDTCGALVAKSCSREARCYLPSGHGPEEGCSARFF